MDNFYALIMAGGGGTRLWPLSRKSRPKQMLPLVGDRTMFQLALDRLAPLLPSERILVVTGQDQVAQLQADAPHLPAENFIVEPFGQNTGPAVGLAAVHVQQRTPDAVMAVLTADHHIANVEKFRRVLRVSVQVAREDYIVTLGIAPNFPATGYGYIRRGKSLTHVDGFQIYHAEAFTEKPDLETAAQFLLSGLYSWNSGMFIFHVGQLMEEYARQQPTMHTLLMRIQAAVGQANYTDVLSTLWPQMPRLSIDYAVMENAQRMAVIPVEMGWSDVGSWASLFDVLESDEAGNVTRGDETNHVHLDTRDTLIVSDRIVATIGLRDLVIVDTDDVLLVCQRKRSQEVRQIVDQLRRSGKETYL